MKSSWTRRREQAAQAERSGKVLRRLVPRESASGPRAPLVQVNSSWTVMEPKHERTAAQKELRFPNPLRTYLESKVSPGPVSCHRGLCRTAGVGLSPCSRSVQRPQRPTSRLLRDGAPWTPHNAGRGADTPRVPCHHPPLPAPTQ